MRSVLSAGEMRMLSRYLQLITHKIHIHTLIMYLVNTYHVLCAGAGDTAVSVRGGVPGLMHGTSTLEQSRRLPPINVCPSIAAEQWN